jgi:hypothetical protein
VLDPGERLNEESMYAIYEKDNRKLGLLEEENEEPFDLNEVEQLMRQMRQESPDLYARVSDLRDGIRAARAARAASQPQTFAFFRAGRYQKLALLDGAGSVVTSDPGEVINAIRCGPEEPGLPLPPGYNATLMAAKKRFDEEVRLRHSQQRHAASLSQAQRYVLRELRVVYESMPEGDDRGDLETMEAAFRKAQSASVQKEISRLRRADVSGAPLLDEIRRIYFRYCLRETSTRQEAAETETAYPRIVCSEGLVAG